MNKSTELYEVIVRVIVLLQPFFYLLAADISLVKYLVSDSEEVRQPQQRPPQKQTQTQQSQAQQQQPKSNKKNRN